MAVYPGNPHVRFEEQQGKTSVHTAISLASHTGTHIDAPKHVFPDGAGMEEFSLDHFIGPCRVLDMSHREFGEGIQVEDLTNANIQADERVLFKTKNSVRGFAQFYPDYVFLSGSAANFLAERGVGLVGIDSLSIKQRGAEDNRPHTALLSHGVPILEGLDFSMAGAGEYTLVCLPLSLPLLDGAPARAVLLSKGAL